MKTHIDHWLPWPLLVFLHRLSFASTMFRGARLWALPFLFAAGRVIASDDALSSSPGATLPATNGLIEPSAKPSPTAGKAADVDATNGLHALDDKHQLAIGDQISFRIVEDEEDPKNLTITDSGELEVPYIGRFNAVCKNCKELASQLKTELEKDYYYHATIIIAVNVMAKSRGRVSLGWSGACSRAAGNPQRRNADLGQGDYAGRRLHGFRRQEGRPSEAQIQSAWQQRRNIYRQRGQGP